MAWPPSGPRPGAAALRGPRQPRLLGVGGEQHRPDRAAAGGVPPRAPRLGVVVRPAALPPRRADRPQRRAGPGPGLQPRRPHRRLRRREVAGGPRGAGGAGAPRRGDRAGAVRPPPGPPDHHRRPGLQPRRRPPRLRGRADGGRAQGRADALGRPDRPRAGHPARAGPGRPQRGVQPRRPLRGRRLRPGQG